MSGLNASLATALSGLSADQGALEVTTNNVANANTPGYSRQVPILVTSDPVVVDPLTLGRGVTLRSIDSIRDPLLESRIQQESQAQGQLDAQVAALQQTQVNFTSSNRDVGASLSNFFNSINQLSANPSDLSLRQSVLTSAGNLASSFNLAANNLTVQRNGLDVSVVQSVGQINQLTTKIAQLNTQIANLQNGGESAGSFVDQRTTLIDQLSGLVDVSVIQSDNSITLTTANGTALVSGQQSFQLSTQLASDGFQHVFSAGNDITSKIVSGQLGGVLQVRDQQIPAFQSQLDTLASSVANSVNAVQVAGFDLNGNAATGVNFFTPPPVSGVGAAANFTLAITDPALIAASSDGTPGSNGNAEALYALRNQGIVNGQNPTDYYAGIILNVGNATANAVAEQSASGLVAQQLSDQRSALSGVSLDEEAANMTLYQKAYEASAQMVSTINSMMQTVINMKAS